MAYSYQYYNGDGSTTTFSVPFPYINQTDVSVTVGGIAAAFTWPNSGQVTITPAPPAGVNNILIKRSTQITSPLVTFVDGSFLRGSDLNTDTTQTLYLCQEASDAIGQAGAAGTGAAGSAGLVLATPTASAGNATLRAIAPSDLASALASPPTIGATAPGTGTFTALTLSFSAGNGLTANASSGAAVLVANAATGYPAAFRMGVAGSPLFDIRGVTGQLQLYDDTNSYSPLVYNAGVASAGTWQFATTGDASSTTTGSVQVAGGLGVAKTLWANTLNLAGSQSQNAVFAAPAGSSGAPSWRALATSDIATALTTPGPIGGTTPSTGAFTGITASTAKVTATAANTGYTLDTNSAGLQVAFSYNDNGVQKWQQGKDGSNNFFFYSSADSINYIYAVHGGSSSGYLTLNTSLLLTAITPSSINAGQVWYDSTQQELCVNGGAASSPLKEVLSGAIFTQTASVTVANTTSYATAFGAGVGTLTLPANFLVAGKTIRITQRGYYSSTGTPTLSGQLKLGGTSLTSGGVSVGAVTNYAFEIIYEITCRTAGTSGTVYAQGKVCFGNALWCLPSASTTTINTTIANAIDAGLIWNTASASNTATCTNAIVEVLN